LVLSRGRSAAVNSAFESFRRQLMAIIQELLDYRMEKIISDRCAPTEIALTDAQRSRLKQWFDHLYASTIPDRNGIRNEYIKYSDGMILGMHYMP
jgi:hypothetical protein